jgi:DNA-binding LacI/PurR family transcriptional regulator
MKKRKNTSLTQLQVAQLLGTSVATVSNAFNKPSQLSRELREHILSECKKIGYYGPRAKSRNGRTEKTRVVGVMLSNQLSYSFADPVANTFLQGLAEVLEEQDINLLIIPSRYELAYLSGVEAFVEGFIVYGPPSNDRLDELLHYKKEIVAIDFQIDGFPSVNIDNAGASRKIASHAFNSRPSNPVVLGLRISNSNKICRLSDSHLLSSSNVTVQRLSGFKKASLSSGIYLSEENIWNIPDNSQSLGYEAAKQALLASPKTDLILCMSDNLALGAIKAITDMGYRVPEDILVTGFDGINEGKSNDLTLTTIAQPNMEKGRVASEIILGLRDDEDIVLASQMIVGRSCPHSS